MKIINNIFIRISKRDNNKIKMKFETMYKNLISFDKCFKYDINKTNNLI